MKISLSHFPARGARREARGGISSCPKPKASNPDSAFTMIEIAICLAIIGFALVAIIGVLPFGMNTQRDNREETVINQDATVLLEAIRSGARGADDLTNYVYAISNTVPGGFGYNQNYLTSGARIVGLLSTPEFVDGSGKALASTVGVGYTSNHIVAYVRSISGLSAEKPPQNNPIMVSDTFSYRVLVVNAPVAVDTNSALTGFSKQLAGNLRELRLTFLWPQLPNGYLGNGRQTFRSTIAGQLARDTNSPNLYFYQSQSFTNAP